jgi:glycosyltransferase involved in cell wall biosynthesis
MTTADPERPLRIAFLSYSSGVYDARTIRMARSAVEAGHDVVVYARLQGGLPAVEQRDGYLVIRAQGHWWLGVPGLDLLQRRRMARRAAAAQARTGTVAAADAAGDADAEDVDPPAVVRGPATRGVSLPGRILGWVRRSILWVAKPRWAWQNTVLTFPLRPCGWASGLDAVVADSADIWHGMWAGSLPALLRLQKRFGGLTIYDSRDVYMESREFAITRRPLRDWLAWLERRWARRVDRVLTVNESYADLIVPRLRVVRPAVVMNCPGRWYPPEPPPDRIRTALRIPPETAIVLYQGQLTSGRGIEETMDAILQVPDAVLVLLGFGRYATAYAARAARAPYAGRVMLLDPVPPDELLSWTASADVSVMAIQPTTINHRYTTPQKLFESLAAGVPVVASDLPGMAEVVRSTGAGLVCDPTSPGSIAAAIRQILAAPAGQRAELRATTLRAAHERYNWEAQVVALFALYEELAAMRPARR